MNSGGELGYAVAMTPTPVEVSDELFAELHKQFRAFRSRV
jgi:hypothetical protein